MKKIELTPEQEFSFAKLKNIIAKAKTYEDMKKLCTLYAKHFVIVQSKLSAKQHEYHNMGLALKLIKDELEKIKRNIEKCQKN